jgi:uncharacterized protein
VLILISPAKKLDPSPAAIGDKTTRPEFLQQSLILMRALRKYSVDELGQFMKLSPALAELNHQRNRQWKVDYDSSISAPALMTFNGEVYNGLDARSLSAADRNFAQQHLRILSGLYGLLRPLDLMMPYRLEMGKPLATKRGKNLYEFWGERISEALTQQLQDQGDDVLINLASKEYIKAAQVAALPARVITPEFRSQRGDDFRMIGVFAKKARGLMCRYIIQNRLKNPEQLKDFDLEGYLYNPAQSSGDRWAYTRP